MNKLTIDFETRSAAPLKSCGAAAYAQHPTTEAICLAVKRHGAPPRLWLGPAFRASAPLFASAELLDDAALLAELAWANTIEAHNAQFEYFIWRYVMPRYGFSMFDVRKLRDSAAKAAMYGLPRSLEQACLVAGVPQQKDMEGSRLMMRLCRPRHPRRDEMLADPHWADRLYWFGSPEEFAREGRYCMQDVRSEEALSDALPELPEGELRLWQLDLDINSRGVRIDVPAVRAVLDGVERYSAQATEEFKAMTGLASPRQRDATLKLLLSLGAELDGLTARDVEAALKTDCSCTVRRILELRASLSRSSTAKYQAFLDARGTDDRIRGCFMYHGAGTGRWTGKIVQPQNFPRGEFSDVDGCIRLFEAGDLAGLQLFYGDPMIAASTCIRGMIVPAPGHDFVCADYSSIEGRTLAWLAGEESALEVYRQGQDAYKVAASAIYHVGYESVDKHQRRVGKVAELALGYQGAVGAFQRMALNYGVELPEAEVKDIVDKWRDRRPLTVRLWRELERACALAVEHPGRVAVYRGVRFLFAGKFLSMTLPSGRRLWYMNPRLESKPMPWGSDKGVIAYDGVDSVTRKWGTSYLYGGLLAENLTQATARDLLANAMFSTNAAGYSTVMHVHDELIAEVPEGFGSVEEFVGLMRRTPAWAEGLPVKADGWRGKRYRK